MDIVTRETRSKIMAAVQSHDTIPEHTVRRMVHRMGFRFRLHRKDLPGKPDLTFPRLRKVIFVHGCFWHQHPGCRRAAKPASNREFWERKFRRNVERDAEVIERLRTSGWSALIVWECELSQPNLVAARIKDFLDPA